MTNQVNVDLEFSTIKTSNVIQLTLTLKVTSTVSCCQMSVTVFNSPIQEYTHPGDHIPLTYNMTPGYAPVTV